MIHPMTLQWGRRLGDRFSEAEAQALWSRFEPVDRSLQAEEEHIVPGFQGRETRYFFNEVPESLTVDGFVAGGPECLRAQSRVNSSADASRPLGAFVRTRT